jgi:hypothetical protein
MSTNFPTSLDSYAALVDGVDILEAADQNNVRDAIEAIEAKVGINGSAVATSHDYKIAQLENGILQSSGATVFNSTMTASATFQDLDLSATVGSNIARCLFEVRVAGTYVYVMRAKGYGSVTFAQHYGGSYAAPTCFYSSSNPGYAYIYMDTDSNGIVEHGSSSNVPTITVKLINYIR